MRKYLLCLLAGLCFVMLGKAQNVTVSPGAGNYATLKAAFDAINAGTHTGTITINIVANTTETDSLKLNASGTGVASYTSITISPSGGTAKSITGSIAGSMIILDGADNVTFNGLNTGGNSLTIANTATGSVNTLLFRNDATNNTINNCIVQGAASASGFGVISFAGGITTGNDGNTISNTDITGVAGNLTINGIFSSGTSAAIDNSGIVLNNNRIYDYFNASLPSAAINIAATNAASSSSWTISNNRFYQTSTRTFTTANIHQCINISTGSGYVITGNTIGYAANTAIGVYTLTGTIATRFYAMFLGLTAGTATSIQNNTITAINLTTSSGTATGAGVLCGIVVSGTGDANIGTVTGNTIGSTTITDALVATPSTTQGALVGINLSTTGTVAIANNSFGGFTSASATAAVAGGVFGITVSGATTLLTINNNTFGNTLADNMRAGVNGTTTGASIAAAISLASTPTQTNIYNNTIRNFSSYGSGAGYVRGIFTTTTTTVTASANIYNNTIFNLVTNGTTTTLTSGLTCAQGIHYASGVGSNIYGNTIYNISSLSTGTGNYIATGIALAAGTAITNAAISVYKNRIYGITNAGTSTTATSPAIIAGVSIRSSNANIVIYNNMISLGNGVTNNVSIVGIWGNHGSTPNPTSVNVYFNNVNIEGTVATGAFSSFCFYRGDFTTTARSIPVDIRNNIFNNLRTGGTGGHYAISNGFGATTVSAVGWGTNAANFNLYNTADPAKLANWGTDQTFAAWKTISVSDVNSLAGYAQTFTNTATADLHISTTIATVIESAGTPITGITDDFDGQTRSSLTPTDIGADAALFIANDVVGPVISYTSLLNTTSTTNRVLTNFATITDAISGVNTTVGTKPRLYFKRSTDANSFTTNTNTTDGWKFVEASNSSSPFSFTIDYSLLNGGSVTPGTQIQYFIVAQDLNTTANVGLSAGLSFTANPTSVALTSAAFPIIGTPTAYVVSTSYAGSYNVGASAPVYTTLKSFFDAINVGIVTGNITVNIIDNTTETSTAQLNQWQEEGAGNYTMTIKPTGVRTITGNIATLVNINGADRVTIDGSIGVATNSVCPTTTASRDLTFANTNTGTTGAVIWISNDNALNPATNITVQNCNISGGGPAATLIGLGAGSNTVGSAGRNNDNIVFNNNNISACQYAIYASGESSINKSVNITANLNTINTAAPNNVGVGGIAIFNYNNVNVSGNNIGEIIRTASPDNFGINVGVGISAFSATGTGIADGASNVTINNNRINNIINSGTFSAIGIGVGGTISGTTAITNNVISGVSANGTSGDIAAGIFLGTVANTTNVYHNSVSMQGTVQGSTVGVQTNACFMYTGTTMPTGLSVRNNIFSNTLLGNTGSTARMSAYALGFAAPYSGFTFNNNNLFAAGAGPGTYTLGITGGVVSGTSRLTLADWQTEVGQDANSKNINVPFSPTVSLLPTDFTGLGGASLGVTTDIDCASRGTISTMGAYQNPLALPVTYTAFQATKQSNAVAVQWSTVNEINNDYFIVQYSTNSSSWVDINAVQAKNATANNYSILHTMPVQGKNYYRLKQVDKDGKFRISDVRVIDFGGKNATITVYPNPVKGSTFTLDLGRVVTSPIIYQVFNAVGQKVQQGAITATQQSINISQLTQGAYLLQLSTGETLKVTKQ